MQLNTQFPEYINDLYVIFPVTVVLLEIETTITHANKCVEKPIQYSVCKHMYMDVNKMIS